ncbi:MAG: hypothetical protein LBF57_01985 [Holosporaceae bacterium]|jgi:hypothetical protein|nr:hypothetical protein [Holosporaceae bacterium]
MSGAIKYINGGTGVARATADISRSVRSIYNKGWNLNRGIKLISRGAGLAANTAMMVAPALSPLRAARMDLISVGLFGVPPLLDLASKIASGIRNCFSRDSTRYPETQDQLDPHPDTPGMGRKVSRAITSSLVSALPLAITAFSAAGRNSQKYNKLNSASTTISYPIDGLGASLGILDLPELIYRKDHENLFDKRMGIFENVLDTVGNTAAIFTRRYAPEGWDNLAYVPGNLLGSINSISKVLKSICRKQD